MGLIERVKLKYKQKKCHHYYKFEEYRGEHTDIYRGWYKCSKCGKSILLLKKK